MSRITAVGALLLAISAQGTAQSTAVPHTSLMPDQWQPPRTVLPRTRTPRPTGPAITVADLMTRLYIFADDSMQGRATGMRGNAKGTAYLAAEARRLGLLPAGDSGTYFQNILDTTALPVLLDASFHVGGGPLQLARDFLPVGTRSLHHRTLAVIYGGRADAPLALTPQQTAGKLVVFTLPAAAVPPAESVPWMPGYAPHAGWARKVMLRAPLPVPGVPGAAAVGLVVLDVLGPGVAARILNANLVLQPQPATPVVLLSTAAARRLFGRAPEAVRGGAAGQRVAVAYTFVASSRNVVAILPGSDPVLRHEYVALGAHNDHLGLLVGGEREHDSVRIAWRFQLRYGFDSAIYKDSAASITAAVTRLRRLDPPRPDSIYNGADDDGSGCVALLEIAEHLAALRVKPKRSILFVWHSSEEFSTSSGSGASWFVSHSPVPLDSIVAQLQADMIGRGDATDIRGGAPNYLQIAELRDRSTELGALIDRVNVTQRYGFAFDTVTNPYCADCSDHAQYRARGIPVAFFFTHIHGDYHSVTDESQYVDYPKMARITAFMNDVAVGIANLSHRLVLDRPK